MFLSYSFTALIIVTSDTFFAQCIYNAALIPSVYNQLKNIKILALLSLKIQQSQAQEFPIYSKVYCGQL